MATGYETQECKRCGKELPLAMFQQVAKGRRLGYCRRCMVIKQRAGRKSRARLAAKVLLRKAKGRGPGALAAVREVDRRLSRGGDPKVVVREAAKPTLLPVSSLLCPCCQSMLRVLP